MEKARAAAPGAALVVMTAFGTIQGAVAAVKKGAENYLTKLPRFRGARRRRRAARWRRQSSSKRRGSFDRLRERNALGHIVTSDPKMQEPSRSWSRWGRRRQRARTGESGTGKELIAEAIHAASPRAGKPFVRLHCAALAESLLESELFGHERGAFTGAVTRREGRFKQADGGTLFLDEIGEIPGGTQVKLLRFLQERSSSASAGNETLKVDVRIIAATNRDLQAEIKRGAFREDLYYRLNVVAVELPPLRDRKGDVAALASFFLRRYAAENGRQIDGFSDDALARLTAYAWPGNVRELENVIERAVVLCNEPRIEVKHLPASVVPQAEREGAPPVPGSTIHDLERYAILKTLEEPRRVDFEGGDDPRRLHAQDSIQAARVRSPPRTHRGARLCVDRRAAEPRFADRRATERGAAERRRGRAMTTVLQVDGLAKTFRKPFTGTKVEAVRGVSFKVTAGEIFGFLGPNGAGRRRRSRCSPVSSPLRAGPRPSSGSRRPHQKRWGGSGFSRRTRTSMRT